MAELSQADLERETLNMQHQEPVVFYEVYYFY